MVEGGGLLNRYMVNSRIGGSNPPPSANSLLSTNKRRQPCRVARHSRASDRSICAVFCAGSGSFSYTPSWALSIGLSGESICPRLVAT